MNTQWKLVPVEPTETMVICGFESEPDECFTDEEVWEQYQEMSGCQQAAFRAKLCWAAMLGAATEPPAVETVEVIGYRVRYEQNPEAEYLMYQEPEGLYSSEAIVLLSEHRALVAQLLAERNALQAELTKARECIGHVLGLLRADKPSHAQYAILQYQDFPKDQSAPADKGQVNPEHTLFNEIRISEPVNEDGEPTRYLITEAQLQRIRAMEADKGQGEPVATLARKYDDTLMPFVALMRKELHANADKGDRPGWLSMSADTCLLEIIYHFGKLQASVKRGDGDGMAEYGADVANMCMMLPDICGVIDLVRHNEQTAPVADGTTSDKYKAELYDEVWQMARDMGFANVTDALSRLDDIDGIPRLNPIKQ